MNFKYVKSEIYNLGFSEEGDVDISIVLQAINRAVDTIANTVRPILSTYTIAKSEPSQLKLMDFRSIAKDAGETFLGFGDIFEMSSDGYVPCSNRAIIGSYMLQLTTDREYLVFYKRLYTPVDEHTPDNFEFELDADLHVLIPLLAAFYVWQDDEERKADKLYNDYEMKRNDIVARGMRTIAYVRGE
jgi:hypothetical protein